MAYTVWSAGELVGHVAKSDFLPDTTPDSDGLTPLSGWFYATPRFETIKPSLEKARELIGGAGFLNEVSALIESAIESGDDSAVLAEFERRFTSPDASTRADQLFREYAELRLELRDASGTVVPTAVMFTQPWPRGIEDFPISDADRAALTAQGVNLNSPAMFTAFLGTLPEEGASK